MTPEKARSPALLLCLALTASLLAAKVTAEELIFVAEQEIDDTPELFKVDVSGAGAGITAGAPVRLNGPLVSEGAVLFGIPFFNIHIQNEKLLH